MWYCWCQSHPIYGVGILDWSRPILLVNHSRLLQLLCTDLNDPWLSVQVSCLFSMFPLCKYQLMWYIKANRGACDVMVIVVGNGYGNTSSKYWMRLIAFHIALIPLGKVWIQLFSLQLWVGQTGLFSLGKATSLEGKLNSNLLNCFKIDLVSYPALAEGLVNMIKASLAIRVSSPRF